MNAMKRSKKRSNVERFPLTCGRSSCDSFYFGMHTRMSFCMYGMHGDLPQINQVSKGMNCRYGRYGTQLHPVLDVRDYDAVGANHLDQAIADHMSDVNRFNVGGVDVVLLDKE